MHETHTATFDRYPGPWWNAYRFGLRPEPQHYARERNQQNRIADGVKSGQLTPKETQKLEKQQQHIQNQEKRDMAKNNGHLTKAEQAKLNREQNRASKNIYDKKHNDKKD